MPAPMREAVCHWSTRRMPKKLLNDLRLVKVLEESTSGKRVLLEDVHTRALTIGVADLKAKAQDGATTRRRT